MIVVDDHVLFAVLVGRVDETPTPVAGEDVYTTGGWYYRLARAIRDNEFTGALSRRVSGLSPEVQRAVTTSLHELPREIGILSPRMTVPVMAALSSIGRFNLLQAEALATALVLHAQLRVIVASENLRAACARLHLDLTVTAI
ncbi:MAG TPA: hypothetical protein VIJ60_04870 [Acidimicrobiales bacterium]